MLHSMTAFASLTGEQGDVSWTWEMRSVNGRGLDIRLRLPEGVDGLEAAVRKAVSATLSRGNVSINLKLNRAEGVGEIHIDPNGLSAALKALEEVEAAALEAGVNLLAPTTADILSLRGVQKLRDPDAAAAEGLKAALLAEFEQVLTRFCEMRASEGQAIGEVLGAQLSEMAELTAQASDLASKRGTKISAQMQEALARVLDTGVEVDEQRVAQELAIHAVKSDVTEELDRLRAHVEAARELLASGQPVGRKLDFLSQEFNREANTLCSKSGDAALTAVGLDLKAVIDRFREQVQNVE